MSENVVELQKILEEVENDPEKHCPEEIKTTLRRFLDALEAGKIRAASKQPDGSWEVHSWVKHAILLCFRCGELADYSINRVFQFYDKDTLPPQDLSARAERPRVVPGGTAVRSGAYVGRRVIIMPPSYVNVGAYVDDETMIDSHVLVGSCAQIGKRAHLSAGVQIGGVLEPVGALPVIVEDDVFIGAKCGVFEGTIVRRGAVLGAGVVLTQGTPIYDLVNEHVYRPYNDKPLIVPEWAVVVPGARPARGAFAAQYGLAIQTPVIVRYREPGESGKVSLEQALR